MFVFGLIVISFSAIQLLPTQELLSFAQHYGQGWELVEQFSAPPLGLLSFFHPFLWGGFAHGHGYQGYYFLPSFITNEYMGMLVILCALYAIKFFNKNNVIKIWFVLLLLTLVMAAGVHVMPVAKFLYAFPLTHAFRFQTRISFITSMAVVVLFAYTFDHLLKQDKQAMKREVISLLKWGSAISLMTFIFMCCLIVAINFFINIKTSDQVLNGQSLSAWFHYYQFSNIALWVPFVTFILSGLLLWFLPYFKNKKWILSGLWLIFVFEVCIVSSHFFVNRDTSYQYADFISKIKAEINPTDRISVSQDYFSPVDIYQPNPPPENIRFSDSVGEVHQIQTLDGFVSFNQRKVASLRNGIFSLEELGDPSFFMSLLKNKNDFLSMLGMKYFLINQKYEKNIAQYPDYKKISAMNDYVLFENAKAKPRLYSLKDVRSEKKHGL